jgi:O-succinylhomoserine sulfhydrylase
MAAITTCIVGLVSSGDHIVSIRDLYGGTVGLFTDLMTRFGVETTFVEATDLSDMESAIETQ